MSASQPNTASPRHNRTGPKHRATVVRQTNLSRSPIGRARIVRAMLDVAAERGYARASVTAVAARARISNTTFYEYFLDSEDCFLAAFDECVRDVRRVVAPPYEGPGSWAERVRAALQALLLFLEEENALARLLFVEAPGAGTAVQERRVQVVEALRAVADAGRAEVPLGAGPPMLMNDVIVEGAIAVVRARLADCDELPLLDLLNPLMAVVVYAYVGSEAGAAQLSRGLQCQPGTKGSMPPSMMSAALTAMPLRMTYRTLRVLSAIADNPAANNRVVAEAAGITDQGQSSRLLSRLESLELIRNHGDLAAWAPNQWHLTPQGEAVEHAVRHELAARTYIPTEGTPRR